MTTRDSGSDDTEFVRVVPADAVTEVPAEILKELGDIIAPHDDTPQSHDDTPQSTDAVVINFPTIGDESEAVVIINDADHGSTLIVDSDEEDRIVIVDDDTLDTQFEERRERARRREKFKKMRWLFAAGTVLVVAVVVTAFLASPMFAVRDVTIEGNVYTSASTLDEASRLLRGKSIFTLDTKAASAIIEGDPWVANARITKHFFRSVVVEIEERIPVVWYVGTDNKARVIDANGSVIAVLDGWPTKYLQVAGYGPNIEAGQTTDEVYKAAAQLVTALPDEIRSKTQGLQLSPSGSLSLVLKTGTIIRFGEPTDLQNKLVAVVVLLRRQDPGAIKAIDVSTGDPTVEMK